MRSSSEGAGMAQSMPPIWNRSKLAVSCPARPGVTRGRLRSSVARVLRAALLATLAVAPFVLTPAAIAQSPPPAPVTATPAPPTLSGPAVRATGVSIPLRSAGLPAGAIGELQRQTPAGWITIKTAPADAQGALTLRYRPSRISSRYVLRIAVGGVASAPITVRSRDVTLAAFGDANFGDGVLSVMAQRGALHPWRGVAPTLRRADIAFGNLECAISDRGAPVPEGVQLPRAPARPRRGRALRRPRRAQPRQQPRRRLRHAGAAGHRARRARRRCGARRRRRHAGVRARAAGRDPPRPEGRLRGLLGHRPGLVLRRSRQPGHVERDAPGDRGGRAGGAPPRRRRRRHVPLGRRARDERERPPARVRAGGPRARAPPPSSARIRTSCSRSGASPAGG